MKTEITYLVSPNSDAGFTDDLLNMSPKSWHATLSYYNNSTPQRLWGCTGRTLQGGGELAKGGRSTKSYPAEGLWEQVMTLAKERPSDAFPVIR